MSLLVFPAILVAVLINSMPLSSELFGVMPLYKQLVLLSLLLLVVFGTIPMALISKPISLSSAVIKWSSDITLEV